MLQSDEVDSVMAMLDLEVSDAISFFKLLGCGREWAASRSTSLSWVVCGTWVRPNQWTLRL